MIFIAVYMVIATYAGFWKVFEKARIPGWKTLIPVYNSILVLRLAGKPDWWVVLLFIPFVDIVLGIYLSIRISECFGKGILFGVGLALLPFIFYPILGFGDAEYFPPERRWA